MTLTQFALGATVFLASVISSSSEKNLDWKQHYETAKRNAQSAERPLVVVIESPKTDEEIDEQNLDTKSKDILLREKFELVRVDATTEYGKKVADAFGAKMLPYTAVTNNNSSRIVFRKAGNMSRSDWVVALAKSMKSKASKPPLVSAPSATVVQKPIVVERSSQPVVEPTKRVVYPTAVQMSQQPIPTSNYQVVESPVYHSSQGIVTSSSQLMSSQPTVVSNPTVASQPIMTSAAPVTSQPIINTEMFSPGGVFMLPASGTCFT